MLSAAGAASLQRMEGRPVELWPTLASTVPSWVFWGRRVAGIRDDPAVPACGAVQVPALPIHAGFALVWSWRTPVHCVGRAIGVPARHARQRLGHVVRRIT